MKENSEYKKPFAEDEFPDQAAVQAAGIELPLSEARLLLMLVSRVISHGQSRDRGSLYVAARFMYLIVSARVLRPGGESLPPLIDWAEPPRIPDGRTALRRLGLESADISEIWEQSSTFPTSCLPLRCVLEFLPAEAWPAVAAFIGCGADELAPRIDEALRRHGQQAGPAPLRNALTRLSLVMRTLVTLRRELRAENESRARRERPPLELPAALDRWTALPTMPTGRELDAKANGGRGRRDVSAVPPEQIREALASRLKKIGWGRRRPLDWPRDLHWRTLKELAVLCLLVTASPRVDHLRLLEVDDFDPNHRFEDGSRGPGLRFRRSTMKNGGHADDVYWKRLPDFVGDVLTAWIVCSGRTLGQAGAPLLIPTRITEPGEPGNRYTDGSSLSKFVSGTRYRRRPLIPILGEEWRGYSPHRFRHTITQVVERRFAVWKLEHPSHLLAGYEARAFGELALDHKVKDLGYRDYQQRRRLEEIVALAIGFCWEEFWGDGFCRRGLDPEAIIAARDAVLLLEAELVMTRGQVAELEAKHAHLSRRVRSARGEEKLDSLLDLHSIDREVQARLRQEVGLLSKLAEARSMLDRAKTDEVVLPEDLDGEEYERMRDEALAEPDLGGLAPEPSTAAPLADELLVVDLAELYGVTEMTVRRWRAGTSESPIDPEAWIKVNAKDWRYPVSAIDERALGRIPADDPEAAFDAIRRKRGAHGFGRNRKKVLG